MPTVSTEAGSYQDLTRIRERIDWQARDFYDDDPNAELKFDELLVDLETESRGIFETLWGDQTPLEETGRVDEMRAKDVAAMQLVYPINNIQQVEYKRTIAADYQTLDAERYDSTDHHLILAKRPNSNSLRYQTRGNPAAVNAQRAEWADLAVKVKVTYDRGFGSEPPADILSIQIDLIENLLAHRKQQQTQAAGSADQQGEAMQSAIVTDAIRDRISDVTSPGLATMTI